MAKKRVILTPAEAEEELNKARKEAYFTPEVEKASIKAMVETAKQNGKFGDKILMVLSPVYIHIPKWQREVNIPRSMNIGTAYNKYKWEAPKILYWDGKLYCIDGMHRIYGAYLGKLENVTVEIITDMTEQKAIDLFLEQGTDRKKMSPSDIYTAALEAKKPAYIKLKEICTKNHVQVKGDTPLDNPVGVLTSISDGISMVKSNPSLLNRILKLIGKLQWNGADIYGGKAYFAKILRVMKKLYAYYDGQEKMLENILVCNCKGAKYFKDNIAEKFQDTLFDYLSDIVNQNVEVVVLAEKRSKRKVAD